MTYTVLHNILIDYDGKDDWEYTVAEEEEYFDVAYGTLEMFANRRMHKYGYIIYGYITRSNREFSEIPIDTSYLCANVVAPTTTEKEEFHKRRSVLVEYFLIMKQNRKLHSQLK